MPFFKNLYLTDRFFYVLGTCVFLFFLSYSFSIIFYVALTILLVLVVLMLADIYLLFNKNMLSVERDLATVLSLNDKNNVILKIESKSSLTLSVKLIDEIPFQFKERDFFMDLKLRGFESSNIQYSLVPLIRGEYVFGNIHVFVKTKLSLVAKRETSASQTTVAVYPSIIEMGRQELLALNHPSFLQGENQNRKRGQSYEFDQIKTYVSGDDLRHINWKASSTTNELMINCYEDERSQQIYSIIDKSRVMKMPFNGLTLFDYAINSTLAFSNIVNKKKDKAGLMIFSKRIDTVLKADRGARNLKKIMYALYKEKYDYSEANYEALYSSIRKNIPNRSLIFLYTNFESIYALERSLTVLRLMNQNHLLVVVFFENTELESYAKEEAKTILDIYQLTIAKKFILEKNQIYKELHKHGIQAIKCRPENLSAVTINAYLDFKTRGLI